MEKRIETERLILRPLTENDANDVFEWAGDPIVNKYMPYPVHKSPVTVREWISSIKPENNEFGFVLKETGKVIGSGNIRPESETQYTVGYNINRAYWGKGYATEAASAMIRWAHDTLGIQEFTAQHATANTASGNVLRKCGFQFDRFGQYSRYDGSEIFDATFLKMHID